MTDDLKVFAHPIIITIDIPGNPRWQQAIPYGSTKPLTDEAWDELVARTIQAVEWTWPTEAEAERRQAD